MSSYSGTLSVYANGQSTAVPITLAQVISSFTSLANGIAACGAVQTSDTGQLTISSISSINNSNFGYQVYRFADSNQSTAPIFFRIEFTQYNNTSLGFNIQVGTGSDGAGNITGLTSPKMYFASNRYFTSGVQTGYISGDCAASGGAPRNARIAWTFVEGPNVLSGMFFSLERTVDASGNDNTLGYVVNACLGNAASPSYVMSYTVPYSGLIGDYQRSMISAYNLSDASLAFGTQVGVLNVVPFSYQPFNPSKNVLIYYSTDFPTLSTQVINLVSDGQNHTYLALSNWPDTTLRPGNYVYNNSVANILMRYE